MSASPPSLPPAIEPLGDAALLVTFQVEDARRQATAFADAVRSAELPGVTDAVAAFDVVGVFFCPTEVGKRAAGSPMAAVSAWLMNLLGHAPEQGERQSCEHELPVCYGGDTGPDLLSIAAAADLSVDAVVRLHCQEVYTVGAVGFSPGFAYLEGLAESLWTPRRATPRTRTPAGAVGIGGKYTAVYPSQSPGGWNLIGHCATPMFDPLATPPALLQPGDRVRFIPTGPQAPPAPAKPSVTSREETGGPVLRVESPGGLLSLQDLGRAGVRRWGVAAGGAMDRTALQIANALVGNRPEAAALEATLVGPVLRAIETVELGIAGAVPAQLTGARRLRLKPGESLDLRAIEGARVYISTPGGFEADEVLGGAGTDLSAEFGGAAGASIARGGLLYRKLRCPPRGGDTGPAWYLPSLLPATRPVVLRTVRTPSERGVGQDVWRSLLAREYQVGSDSNRMGVRLRGANLDIQASIARTSAPVAPGAVQVPPSGEPIVLGVDSQTIGGYPLAGCVASVDLPVLAQLRPADRVRFSEISLDDAELLRREDDQRLATLLAGVRVAGGRH